MAISNETASALGAFFFYPDVGLLIKEGYEDPILSPEEADSSERRIKRVLSILSLED